VLNSSYVGKESMMIEHVFYPRIQDRISDGDSLLVRFRLFSDPYSHGWGWAIDDFKINPLIDEAEEINSSSIRIFPNPGKGLLNILLDDYQGLSPSSISVFDYYGKCITSEAIYAGEKMTLDISGNPPGLYLIIINDGHTTRSIKYNLVK
jgi:hypothetical protein